MSINFEFITTTSRLEEVVQVCRLSEAVSIDTEFARFNTYYPIVGLIQLYDGNQTYLIDPLEIEDISSLASLLTDPNVLKIFHACSEDLEVFQHCLGVLPNPVYDTQIAGALLGVGFSVGYQKLVDHYLSVLVPKEETRSDWLQRPLTPSQLDYAALDVIYLLEVYKIQQVELQDLQRLEWVTAECSQLAKDIPTQISPSDYYLKVKNLTRLNPQQLTILQKICAWREVKARQLDKPRNRIIDEKSLFLIAQLMLDEKSSIQQQGNVAYREIKRYGDDLVDIVNEALNLSEDNFVADINKPTLPVSSKSIKALKQIVEDKAKVLNLAPEMLAKRRHLEELLRSADQGGEYLLPSVFRGWRESAIGTDLIASLKAGLVGK